MTKTFKSKVISQLLQAIDRYVRAHFALAFIFLPEVLKVDLRYQLNIWILYSMCIVFRFFEIEESPFLLLDYK